jgi:hypothetical protein
MFGKIAPNAYDSMIQSYASQANWLQVIKLKRLSEIDGYSSAIIDQKTKEALTGFLMRKHVPDTGSMGVHGWGVYWRFMTNAYRYASEWNYETIKWDQQQAYQELLQCYQLNKPSLIYDPVTNTVFQWDPRYYDESAQTLDSLVKLGGGDGGLWNYINDRFWKGNYYSYQASGNIECEVGGFNLVIAHYHAAIGYSLPNFERCMTDLDTKLLVNGWNSPLWSHYVIVHATSNPQLRLGETLAAYEALHAFSAVFDSTLKGRYVQLLTGNPTAWQGLLQSGLYVNGRFSFDLGGTPTDGTTSIGLAILFLQGIVPNTGSLAIPLNEEQYGGWEFGLPATHFKFDYNNRQIRIPVFAGQLKFLYGSTSAIANFPSDGIYEVTFTNDWNTVQSVNKISNLGGFYYMKPGGTTPPPSDKGTLRVFASYQGSYVTTPVTIMGPETKSGTTTTDSSNPLTFEVTAGTYIVSGNYGGTTQTASVTVVAGQTVDVILNFGGSPPPPPPKSIWDQIVEFINQMLKQAHVDSRLLFLGAVVVFGAALWYGNKRLSKRAKKH